MKQWWQQGSLWVWLSASALLLCLGLFLALLSLISAKGLQHLWPGELYHFQLEGAARPMPAKLVRTLRQADASGHATGKQLLLLDHGDQPDSANRQMRYQWLAQDDVLQQQRKADAVVLQLKDGRWFYGRLDFIDHTAEEAPAADAWLKQMQAGQWQQQSVLQLDTGTAALLEIAVGDIRTLWLPNQLSLWQKWRVYGQEWWHFLSSSPHRNQAAGGIFPAIFGTLVMVLLMAVLVTPFGVLAAIYLHEYAPKNWLTHLIRTAVYNLAGIPSVVLGVFGLAFFVYVLGGSLDRLFYADQLPSPTFGTPGLFWASLTLALLTLPVVIVATEEGLAQLPAAQRLGSFALGATQAETIWKVVVPQAAPAMITGLILAVARAAGEVAPLMLVGVVKSAPQLPIDGQFPYIHLERKFMHLGYHLYDVGFQSADTELAMSLVYTIGLVLLSLILVLNLSAFLLRQHLRKRFRQVQD